MRPSTGGLQGTKVSVGQEPLSTSGAPGSAHGTQRAQGPWVPQCGGSPDQPLTWGMSNGLPQACL